MRKIITFLGVRPLETTYAYSGKNYHGRVFAEALRQFVNYDQMLVCTTDEARQGVWPILAGLEDARIQEVPIQRAESTREMWAIFDAILQHIEPYDTVIFDITHGLRSLPFLVFLFAAYLKTAQHVTIEAILYGALELGDSKTGKPAPVIDLSEFITMLDWLTATDMFVQTGEARNLAGLLNPEGEKNTAAAKASETLLSVSQAAFLCQPFTLMTSASALEGDLMKAQDELELVAHPFGVLRDQITGVFRHFAAEVPGDPASTLKAEMQMVEWYFQNNSLIQAMTLAREWLIDAASYRLGLGLDLRAGERRQMEMAVSGIARLGREIIEEDTQEKRFFNTGDLNQNGFRLYDLLTEDERLQLASLWNDLQPIRNLFDHAEHQKGPMKISKAVSKAHSLVLPGLRALAKQWGIE
jgi:CRISPR-associated DxTHG motif protein